MNRTRPLLALLLLCWLIPAASPGASFRTISFFPIKGLEDIAYLAGDELLPVELPARQFSPTYKISGDGPIVFARPGAEGEKPVPLLTVKRPNGLSRLLLIFLPVAESDAKPCKVIVLDDSLVALRPGELRFINLSTSTVFGYLGERKLSIAPKKISKVEAPKRLAKDGTYYVSIATRKDKKQRPLCKTRWPHESDTRRLIFIFNDARRRSVRMMGIDDVIEPQTTP